ncbi:MAG: 4Fe-4S binding protein [Chloroflexi bacterium]|nr:4Fe-4S binding protein [Chloroflexota bacterium]
MEKSHLRADVDQDSCTGCQDCVERCFFNAIEMKKYPSAKKLKASVEIACLVQVEGFNEEG